MAAIKLSKAELNRAHDRLQSLRNRITKVKAEAEATTEKIVRTAEVGGMAFAMGVMQGRTGGVEIVGVPIELAVGLGLNVAGYFGAAGRMSDHLNHLGDGALAAYLTTLGRGVGQEWNEKSRHGGGDKKAKAKEIAKGVGLTDAEVQHAAAVAAASRAA